MKLILTQEVTGLGAARRRGRGQGRLRPQLPRPARLRDPLDPRRREDRRVDQEGPRLAARSATTTTPTRSRPSSRPPRSTSRSGPATAAACSAPSPPPTSPARSPRSRRGGRQAHDRARQPDQVARRPPGDGQAARRRLRHGRAQRRPGLTLPFHARPAPVHRGGPSCVRGSVPWRRGHAVAPGPIQAVHERWKSPVSAPGRAPCRQTNVQIPDGERVNDVDRADYF